MCLSSKDRLYSRGKRTLFSEDSLVLMLHFFSVLNIFVFLYQKVERVCVCVLHFLTFWLAFFPNHLNMILFFSAKDFCSLEQKLHMKRRSLSDNDNINISIVSDTFLFFSLNAHVWLKKKNSYYIYTKKIHHSILNVIYIHYSDIVSFFVRKTTPLEELPLLFLLVFFFFFCFFFFFSDDFFLSLLLIRLLLSL